MKAAAAAELTKLYNSGQQHVDPADAYNILGELSSSGYAWYPQLPGLSLANKDEERLASFILGGLVFGGYAQLAGTNHLMQPKRSRLFLAISLRQDTSRTAEEHLLERFGHLVGRPTAEVPYTPTFFPMLLMRSAGPVELLQNALELRKSGEVKDYRAWLREALDDFNSNGRIPVSRAREVESIASAIQRKIGGFPLPDVEIKISVADVLAHKPPGVGVNLTEPAKAAWGWVIEQLPGIRHRKLLARAVISDLEYVAIDRRVQTVWRGLGLP